MRRLTLILRSPYFWLLLVYFLFCIVLHYSEYIPFIQINISSILGLERHSLERILFLAMIVIGGAVFGLKGGLAYMALALTGMLPRVILISPFFADAMFEMMAVITIGGGMNWWLRTYRRETGRREQTLLKLEAVRRELQSNIQAIKENEKRLSVLHSITTAIIQLSSLDEILNTAVKKVQETLSIDGVLVFLIEQNTEELSLKAYQGVSREFARQVDGLKVGEGFNGWVAETGEPTLIEDSSTDPRLSREAVRREGIGSQFIVPLMSREKVVGTLCAIVRAVRKFTRDEEQLLVLIGAELGVAVEKAALAEESRRAGERFRELFEKAHDSIWLQDTEGKIINANQATADYTGYELDEIIGEDVSKFLRSEGLELAREVRRKLLSGEDIEQPYEQKVIRKDGSEATIMLTTSIIADEGMPPIFQHISRDVTREKQLQENLHLYARQITRAQEEERKRIARELHDDSIQALVVLSQQVDDITTNSAKSARIESRLDKIRKEIDEILDRMRRFTQDLRPPTLDYLGLLPALRELVSNLQQQSDIESTLQINEEEHHFTAEDELIVYRIVQEALSNVWRHSEAKSVQVVISFDESKTTVEISDDGKGFEIGDDLQFVKAGKIGLAGMQERADLLNGKLNIQSKPGNGTKVRLEIPNKRWIF